MSAVHWKRRTVAYRPADHGSHDWLERSAEVSKVPIVDLSRVGDAAVLLVDRLTDPNQKRERADARAYAKQARTRSDIERRSLLTEEKVRVSRQENAERIAAKAARKVQKNARPDDVSPDWYAHARERLWNVSDEDLQEVWAHILAGEVNSPGSFSKRTLSIVGDLEKRDAETFSTMCRFSVTLADGEMCPTIFRAGDPIYHEAGIDYDSLINLASMGLIKFDGVSNTSFTVRGSGYYPASYFGRRIDLAIPTGREIHIGLGLVKLSRAGDELLKICALVPIDGYFDYILNEWKSLGAEEIVIRPLSVGR